MSTITIQIGQCGNQVGSGFFDTLSKEGASPSFFRESRSGPVARAVLIDMEPKVISHALQGTAGWRYDGERSFFKQSGSGNNWAYGYYAHGPECLESTQEIIRKEVESCDNFRGLLILQSLAGGTGSGFGAYVTEELRDWYPESWIFNHVVWPYGSGEVILQHYNTIFSLAHLYDVSDAISISENDVVESICHRLLGESRPSFHSINRVIARDLASVFLPAQNLTDTQTLSPHASPSSPLTPASSGDVHSQVWTHVLPLLTACPSYRLLTARSIPQVPERSAAFSQHSWSQLLKHTHQMMITDAKHEQGINWRVSLPTDQPPGFKPGPSPGWTRCIANALFCRGGHISDRADILQHTLPFHSPLLYPCWHRHPAALLWSPHPMGHYDKTVTLLSNSQSVVHPLDHLLRRGSEMFQSRAYTHQYGSYGLSEDSMQHCLARLEQILRDYQTIE